MGWHVGLGWGGLWGDGGYNWSVLRAMERMGRDTSNDDGNPWVFSPHYWHYICERYRTAGSITQTVIDKAREKVNNTVFSPDERRVFDDFAFVSLNMFSKIKPSTRRPVTPLVATDVIVTKYPKCWIICYKWFSECLIHSYAAIYILKLK